MEKTEPKAGLSAVEKIALEIYKQRSQNFNFVFDGNEEAIKKQRMKAAQFFKGEAMASFSIAQRWVEALKEQRNGGSKST